MFLNFLLGSVKVNRSPGAGEWEQDTNILWSWVFPEAFEGPLFDPGSWTR